MRDWCYCLDALLWSAAAILRCSIFDRNYLEKIGTWGIATLSNVEAFRKIVDSFILSEQFACFNFWPASSWRVKDRRVQDGFYTFGGKNFWSIFCFDLLNRRPRVFGLFSASECHFEVFSKLQKLMWSPSTSNITFLVSNESLEHYLNAILQKFCSRAYQFLKTKSNVSKFMILLSKISDLPPKCNLKYFRKFWSCLCTIMSFTIIGIIRVYI